MRLFAVVQFPGSNDDRDMRFAFKSVLGVDAELVWHGDDTLPAGTEGVLLPGGFSYGDYLRTGAMARFSPVVSAIVRFARDGGPVLGTCNGQNNGRQERSDPAFDPLCRGAGGVDPDHGDDDAHGTLGRDDEP